MISMVPRYEFELKIKKFDVDRKRDMYDMPSRINREEEEKEKVVETMEFKSLTAVEVMRKLIDYLRD